MDVEAQDDGKIAKITVCSDPDYACPAQLINLSKQTAPRESRSGAE